MIKKTSINLDRENRAIIRDYSSQSYLMKRPDFYTYTKISELASFGHSSVNRYLQYLVPPSLAEAVNIFVETAKRSVPDSPGETLVLPDNLQNKYTNLLPEDQIFTEKGLSKVIYKAHGISPERSIKVLYQSGSPFFISLNDTKGTLLNNNKRRSLSFDIDRPEHNLDFITQMEELMKRPETETRGILRVGEFDRLIETYKETLLDTEDNYKVLQKNEKSSPISIQKKKSDKNK
ncbi:MAG: hypothetical protein ACTSXQ_00140 [Alphaproteobacteria bacterium]